MNKNHPIHKKIEEGITNGVFSGASLLIQKKQDILWDSFYGNAQIKPSKRPLEESSYFDIASLTKPFCTATLYMVAYQEGTIHLNHPVEKFYPQSQCAKVTLSQLLNHTSGLPRWKPYYEELIKTTPGWVTDQKGQEWIVAKILDEKLENKPGTQVVYSDLDYILLGSILERLYKTDLPSLFNQKIAQPLNLSRTFFNPIDQHHQPTNPNPHDFVATEECTWRNKVLCGEVMDDHAYVMGGVAGHAGLFSTTKDILEWVNELQKAKNGTGRLIQKRTFDLFCHIPENRNKKDPFFTLGFDAPSDPSSSGKYFSSQSLGHLGYTGCSFWWDMKNNWVIILLSNRVHPNRMNNKIHSFRPELHDVIVETLLSC